MQRMLISYKRLGANNDTTGTNTLGFPSKNLEENYQISPCSKYSKTCLKF